MAAKRALVQNIDREDYKDVTVMSQNIKPGYVMWLGGIHVMVTSVKTNDHGEKIFHLKITGSTVKSRSKMMLIIPQNLPVTILVRKKKGE